MLEFLLLIFKAELCEDLSFSFSYWENHKYNILNYLKIFEYHSFEEDSH